MAERYYITGAQLGIIISVSGNCMKCEAKLRRLLREVIAEQFIGRIEGNEYDKYEIIIKKKEEKE